QPAFIDSSRIIFPCIDAVTAPPADPDNLVTREKFPRDHLLLQTVGNDDYMGTERAGRLLSRMEDKFFDTACRLKTQSPLDVDPCTDAGKTPCNHAEEPGFRCTEVDDVRVLPLQVPVQAVQCQQVPKRADFPFEGEVLDRHPLV